MNKYTELPSTFKYQLEKDCIELEPLRKKTKLKIKIAFIPFFLKVLIISGGLTYVLILATLLEFRNDYEVLFAGFVGLTLTWGITALFFNRKKKAIYQQYLYQGDYFLAYKKQVVNKMIELIDENIVYNPEKGIPQNTFKNSGFPLFSNPSSYFSSDSINGTIGATDFTFSEIEALQITDFENKDESILFRGVFFVADLHKQTVCKTIVYPDLMKYFSKLLVGKFSEETAFSKQNYQRIKLEDTEFERYFEVYGTDQVESRYLLSTALMSRMVDFKRNTKKDIMFSFKDSKIYFGIYYSGTKNLFRPPLFKSTHHLEPLENYLSDLKLMTDILKELNLNSKIS